MSFIINGISIALILTGLVFFLGAAVGMVRLPDFYTRMHAAGKGDTLSTILMLAGLALFNLNHLALGSLSISDWLVPVKIMAIGIFTMLTSPTSTHALMQSGFEDGIPHFRRPRGDAAASDSTEPSPSPPTG